MKSKKKKEKIKFPIKQYKKINETTLYNYKKCILLSYNMLYFEKYFRK